MAHTSSSTFEISGSELFLPDALVHIASSRLLFCYYRSLLSSLCYIALLIYWILFVAHRGSMKNPDLFSKILQALFTKYSSSRTWDASTMDWSLEVAGLILLEICHTIFEFLFPTYFWTHIALFTAWHLLRPIGISDLWLQKLVTALARFDRNIWKWGVLAIESATLSIIHVLDFPASRSFATFLWRLCYQMVSWVSSRVVDHAFFCVIIVFLSPWYDLDANFLLYTLSAWILYRFSLKGLGVFANPDPPEHKYTPLKNSEDMRVLLLLPRFAFTPICCRLLQGPLREYLIYETISYKWDSEDATEEILVDGCRRKVTKSVHEVLASYSSLIFPKLLWIDAVCIDQENKAEKNQQVPRMDEIYQNGLFTTVFLGRVPLVNEKDRKGKSSLPFCYDSIYPADEQTKTHFRDAHLSFDLLNEFNVLKRHLSEPGMDIYQAFHYFPSFKPKGRQWVAFLKMLQHPVFERIWVVQEVALSYHVQVRYGDELIDWQLLADAINLLRNKRDFVLWLELTYGAELGHLKHISGYNIARMSRLRQARRPDEDSRERSFGWRIRLPDVLAESFYFKATEPRDLVYGMISLCEDPIKVSYNTPVEEVFLEAAEELIRNEEFSFLLHAAGLGNRLETSSVALNLPSWVPDWTNPPRYTGFQGLDRRWRRVRKKAENQAHPAIKLEGNKVITFPGYFVANIDDISPFIFDTTDQAGGQALKAMYRLALSYESCWKFIEDSPHTADPYPHTAHNQSLRGAFRATMVGRSNANDLPPAEEVGKFSEWEENLKMFRNNPNPDLSTNGDKLFTTLQSMNHVTQLIESQCGGRRLFTTNEGHIGLCPPHTLPGDFICVASGIDFPVVLRGDDIYREKSSALRSSKKTFKLVGQCYTHGLAYKQMASTRIAEKLEII